MLYDVVLGGVLSATFIPVFVDRLANKEERDAFDSISAVITVSVVVLVVTSLAALVAAPYLITALTSDDPHAKRIQLEHLVLERQVATTFLRWFVIQIAAYGLFALAAALLNTRRRFVAVAWAPIVNNIVCIGILVWFGLWAGRGADLASVEAHHSQLVLLGLGTSIGVVLQGVALIPSLRRADLGLLRWRWNPRDDALQAIARLGAWTFGFVLANQIALFVVTVLAGSVPGPDPVSSYTYAYAFFQLPYGIVAVTVMSVVTPDLSQRWSTGDTNAFLHRMSGGLRAVLVLIVPAAVGMLLLARPAVALLQGYGHSSASQTVTTGQALAMFALGLPGFCTYLYMVRVLQSMQRTRVAFYLYLVENGLNIVLALLLVHTLGVRGLALSLSIAYTVAAVAVLAVFHLWFGRLAPRETWAPLWRVVIACIPMAVVVLIISNLSGSTTPVGLLARVGGAVVAGGLTFGAMVIWLGQRAEARRGSGRPPRGPGPGLGRGPGPDAGPGPEPGPGSGPSQPPPAPEPPRSPEPPESQPPGPPRRPGPPQRPATAPGVTPGVRRIYPAPPITVPPGDGAA